MGGFLCYFSNKHMKNNVETDDEKSVKPPVWVIAVLVLFAGGVVWFFTSGLEMMPYNNDNGEAAEENGDDGSEDGSYVGLEEGVAFEQAEDEGVQARVIRRDGEDLLVTMDFVPDRLNFTVEDGVVVDVVSDEEMGGQ